MEEQKKRTKIICGFPVTGKTSFVNLLNQIGYSAIEINYADFYYRLRYRTPEELEQLRELWDSESHLLSGKGFIGRIKDTQIKERNPEFPKNYVDAVKEQIGKVDYIVLGVEESSIKSLIENNLYVYLVYPDSSLLFEIVGRMYLGGYNQIQIDTFCKNHKSYINQIEKCIEGIVPLKLTRDEPFISEIRNLEDMEIFVLNNKE